MDVEVLPTRESVPDPPPDAAYVVVDAYRFSTSVVTLLEEGVTRVRPAETLATAREYARREGWVAGGEPHDEDPAFAVSNSPTRIARPTSRGRQPASTPSTAHRQWRRWPTGRCTSERR